MQAERESSPLVVIVEKGPDAGKQLRLDPSEQILGRASDAHLSLTDRTISRRHLRLMAVGDRVRVRSCDGASPFVVNAQSCVEAELGVGDRLLVGDTVLLMARLSGETGLAGSLSVETLLSGAALDVQGLASIFQLLGALDEGTTPAQLLTELSTWARTQAGVEAVQTVVSAEDATDEVSLRTVATGTLVVVPTRLSDLPTLGFSVRGPTERVRPHHIRLLVVAARAWAFAHDRMRALRESAWQQNELRGQAISSAYDFLGSSPAARQVMSLLDRLAVAEAGVLLQGETGSGKTFVARLLHERGPRARRPLRIINCAALPEALLESELFGHEKGAFTGALAAREGAFEAAGDGTLLLDEIGELSLGSQAKLLRVLEERRFERLGSNRSLPLRARLLTATNRDLRAMVRAGTFRSDLFFRVSVVTLPIPSLRERRDDLPVLAARILGDLSASAGRRIEGFSGAALDALRRHPWPGNVRELRNAIEHAIVLGDTPLIEPGDLPPDVLGPAPTPLDDQDVVRLPRPLEELEALAIAAALRHTQGNRSRAAALLGINRATLYNKLRESTAPGAPGEGSA